MKIKKSLIVCIIAAALILIGPFLPDKSTAIMPFYAAIVIILSLTGLIWQYIES